MKRLSLFKVKTHRVLTWQVKVFILAMVPVALWLSWPLICIGITSYLYQVDEMHPVSRIFVENWAGQIAIFEGSAKVATKVGAKEIVTMIFEEDFNDARKRHAYVLNAWAAGIDTTHFSMIPVPKREPKTQNIARTILDTARQRQWTQLTVVTFDLHSARSAKAYRLAAKPYNISISMVGIPLEGVNSSNWNMTSTGLSFAFSELIKRLYYDIFIF